MGKQPRKDQPKSRRSRPAAKEAKRERTGVHIRIVDEIWWSLFWVAEKQSTPDKPVTVKEILDKAVTWLLEHEAKTRFRQYVAPQGEPVPLRPFWLDSRIHERAEEVGKRDGVARTRVIETAFHLYLKHLGPLASAADIARLKAKQARNPARAWRVANKAGSRYRSRIPRSAPVK